MPATALPSHFGTIPPDRPPSGTAGEPLATFLGWFSVGLGLTEALAPRALGRLIGVGDHPVLVPAFGLRELAAGVGLLTTNRPAGWLWARVAGDVLDLAALGSALAQAEDPDRRTRIAGAVAAVAGVAALDVICARRHDRGGV